MIRTIANNYTDDHFITLDLAFVFCMTQQLPMIGSFRQYHP